MKNLLLLLLLSLALSSPAQGILGAAKKMQQHAEATATTTATTTSSQGSEKQALKEDLGIDETGILSELGLSDDDSAMAAPTKKPSFQVPDTTMPLGWVPDRTNKLVNDYTGILTAEQTDALQAKLLQCYDSCKVEIALLIVPDLGGDAIESFTQNVWDLWRVGNKEKNNGVLIVVKPKNSTDGQVRIQTGYGMEGALPDAFCKRIIDDKMILFFRDNEYYEGIDAALDIIIPVAKGEYSLEQYEEDNDLTFGEAVILILFFGGVIFLILWVLYKAGKSSSGTGGYSGGGFSGGSSWSSGSSWSGGSSGGFGGFGGGFSGGGGASGRW